MTHSLTVLGASLLAALVGANGCQSAVDVHAVQSPAAHFERYRTVALDVSPQSPAEYSSSPQSKDAQAEIRESAEQILRSRGYLLTGMDQADVVVRIEEGRHQRRVSVAALAPAPENAGQTEYQAQIEQRDTALVEGAFVIDAFDGKTKDVVWEGSARAEVTPGKVDRARLRRAVEAVLRSFPARQNQ